MAKFPLKIFQQIQVIRINLLSINIFFQKELHQFHKYYRFVDLNPKILQNYLLQRNYIFGKPGN